MHRSVVEQRHGLRLLVALTVLLIVALVAPAQARVTNAPATMVARTPAVSAQLAHVEGSRPRPGYENGPLVFDHYTRTFVAAPTHPEDYYLLPGENASVSSDGRRVAYLGSVRTGPTSSRCCAVFVSDIDGKHARQLTDRSRYGADTFPSWSPDGSEIVIEYDANSLAIIDARTGEVVRRLLRDTPGIYGHDPAWSPDGSLIVFRGATPAGGHCLFVIHPDGTGMRTLTCPPEGTYDMWPDWSPDGRWLVIVTNRWAPPDQGFASNLALVSRDGDTVRPLTHVQWRASFELPTWSPDGRMIAVARQKPVRPGQPSDGVGTLALYRADGTFIRWVEGPWTQDMDDFYWLSIDWAPAIE